MPNTSIVITSIFAPTEAVTKFANLPNYQLVVAGDKKSPVDWQEPNVTYLDVAAQEALGFGMSAKLPFNHYGRKMMGYLHAIREGAEVIVDTDDDNIPYDDWAFPAMSGSFATAPADKGFVNIYKNFTSHHIWPRGYPLDLILNTDHNLKEADLTHQEAKIGIWQGLADSDPDVDAIYRLVDNTEIFFDKRDPIVLPIGTLCPFNSQNTLVRRELFALLYLPAYVTFRFTDILRGLVAQPIMWAHGYRLGFTQATVLQVRNPHDYVKDFESEIPCYLHPNRVIAAVQRALKPGNTVAEDLRAAYAELLTENIVTAQETELLDLWLTDLKTLLK
ncbi:STELLO glycosyltransferase family protein [Hymenobacter sp. H14-R3]|uniref:STELLO glycosyltransferase family protein n=1 Tax=Hymenobacter sp. H14-R3 TaxID=3046308 RepID=UPI0024B882E8|nr:STELLO glycosyltransferase family protein [Hymenobacter sp. H14-R3]MDJ0364555.1 STELLO glycosyltransferase family protein [Hymenobacter sp. H14-R3]